MVSSSEFKIYSPSPLLSQFGPPDKVHRPTIVS